MSPASKSRWRRDELAQLGGWARKDVAGYDLRALMVGSEGTLGVITAVRLRLRPAPEESIALMAFMRTRAEGCEAMLAVLASGVQPSALDFIDAPDALVRVGLLPRERAGGRRVCAAGRGGRQPRKARADRAALIEALGDAPLAIDAAGRARGAVALARRLQRRGDGSARREGVEDVVFPVERLPEGLERFEADRARATACDRARGATAARATCTRRCWWTRRDEAELDAAEAAVEELFALVAALGGSITGEHGVGWLKRGRLASQWEERALRAARADQGGVRPEGAFEPGQEARAALTAA